jgi:cell wall-associated NlpC family hydrolase
MTMDKRLKSISLKWVILIALFLFSCTAPYRVSTPPRFKTGKQSQLWHHAQTFLGIPYRYGGSDRAGMDCSGLVVRIYKDIFDITLPQSTASLYQQEQWLTLGFLETGDLVFFHAERGRTPEHVGIFLGNGSFIHASSKSGVVVSKLSDPYYKKRFLGARRIQK